MPKSVLFQMVWLKMRKLMTVSESRKDYIKTTLQSNEKSSKNMLQLEEKLWMEFDECTYSWEQESRRPNHFNTKIWQMIQSNNTKAENLEYVISQKFWRKHISWDGTKPRNRSGAGWKRKRMKVLRAGLGAAGDVSS